MAQKDLVGTWRLASYVNLDEAGREREGPLGRRPAGLLIYAADGHMSVSMMRTDDRSPGGAGRAETFMGYAGTWRLDGDRVLHHVLVSAHPFQVNKEQIRDFTLAGDRLVLHGTALINDKPQRRRLVWERLTTGTPKKGKETVKALIAASYGPVDSVALAEAPAPVAGPGQVLVKVKAAGINPLDVKLATGVMREVMPVEHPHILGVDAAGTVEAVGAGVTGFAPGDEVVALTFPAGAVAEYTVVSEGPTIVRRPADLSAERAAALPTPALMAAAIADTLESQPDQTVLLLGADGAVASLLLQLAGNSGARFIGTASPGTADQVRALGVKDVIDYTSGDVVRETLRLQPDGVDVAIDLVNAGPGLAATAEAVKSGGRLVSSLGGPPRFDRDVTATYLGVEHGLGHFARVINGVASGELSVDVTTRPFAESARALADFAAQRTRGRVVITL